MNKYCPRANAFHSSGHFWYVRKVRPESASNELINYADYISKKVLSAKVVRIPEKARQPIFCAERKLARQLRGG